MKTNRPSEILEEISNPTLREVYRIANNACNQGISSVYETAAYEICQLIRPIKIGGSEYHGQYNIPQMMDSVPDDAPVMSDEAREQWERASKLPLGDAIQMMAPETWEKWKMEACAIAEKYINRFGFNDFMFKKSPHTINITNAAHQIGDKVFVIPAHLRIVRCEGTFDGDVASVKSQIADYQHNLYCGLIGTLTIPGVKPFRAKVKEALLYPHDGPVRYELIFVEEE